MNRVSLRIARLLFRVRADAALGPPSAPDSYDGFLDDGTPGTGGSGAAPDPVIDVAVVTATRPDAPAGPPAFDAGSWRFRRKVSDERVLEKLAVGLDHPLWVARFDDPGGPVSIRCGPPLVRGTGADRVVSNPVCYPLDQILLMYALGMRGRGLLVHGAGIVVDGRGYLFPGRSGAGKSTLSRLVRDAGAGRLLSDDRIVIRRAADGSWTLHGTPWPGDARIARNESAPLAGILPLVQADETRLVDAGPVAARDALLPTASIPWYDPNALPPILDLVGDLVRTVPCRWFRFRREPAAADLVAGLGDRR